MKQEFLLSTERCLLREMTPMDAEGAYKLNLHPDIYRFTTDPPFDSIEAAKKFLENYDAYKKHGVGRWAVILKSNREFAGWCGLKYHPEDGETDVGYRLLPEYWGMGLAAETGAGCIKYGFEKGLNRIVARIHKENHRSVRVAEKMGMTYEKDLLFDGVPWLNYVITSKNQEPHP
jgi:[ribosomal protein S5]-alanine N-acetyltransferase